MYEPTESAVASRARTAAELWLYASIIISGAGFTPKGITSAHSDLLGAKQSKGEKSKLIHRF